jgi:hypothetical protein
MFHPTTHEDHRKATKPLPPLSMPSKNTILVGEDRNLHEIPICVAEIPMVSVYVKPHVSVLGQQVPIVLVRSS